MPDQDPRFVSNPVPEFTAHITDPVFSPEREADTYEDHQHEEVQQSKGSADVGSEIQEQLTTQKPVVDNFKRVKFADGAVAAKKVAAPALVVVRAREPNRTNINMKEKQ